MTRTELAEIQERMLGQFIARTKENDSYSEEYITGYKAGIEATIQFIKDEI